MSYIEDETTYSRITDLESVSSCEDDDYILVDSEENGIRRISYENFKREVQILNEQENN